MPHGGYLWYVPLTVAVIVLYAPDGGWFLSGVVVFTYCMVLISPCGLMDIYDR